MGADIRCSILYVAWVDILLPYFDDSCLDSEDPRLRHLSSIPAAPSANSMVEAQWSDPAWTFWFPPAGPRWSRCQKANLVFLSLGIACCLCVPLTYPKKTGTRGTGVARNKAFCAIFQKKVKKTGHAGSSI